MAFLYHISAINVDKNVYIELLSLSNLHTLAFLISSDVYYKIPSIFFFTFKITSDDLPAFLNRSHNCFIYKGYVLVHVYKPLFSF